MHKDTSDHGMSHPFTGSVVVAFDLTAFKNEFVPWLFQFDWSWIH